MNKRYLIISVPAVSGLVLLPLVFFNLSQFNTGTIGVHSMLTREIPIVVLGLVSSLILAFVAVVWLFKKQWAKSFYACCSIMVFFISFIIAGVIGGAFLNAT